MLIVIVFNLGGGERGKTFRTNMFPQPSSTSLLYCSVDYCTVALLLYVVLCTTTLYL